MSGVPAVYYHGTGSENAGHAYTEAPMQHVQRNALRKKLDLTNGQLTPNNNTPLLTQALSVMNNYQAAAAQAGFPPASPHAAGGHGGPQGRSFPAANSPGPIDMYSSGAAAAAAVAAADSVASYVQAAASPQPPTTAFPAIAVSRAPLNYSPHYLREEENVQADCVEFRDDGANPKSDGKKNNSGRPGGGEPVLDDIVRITE
ncbi:hypothetical protein EAI_05655 [Harpegnathos saltator]|uniref:RNA-binding protein Musashi-like protein Rbp6 n=1 Tax=Harpegnathos saltator TaxID=610380 RepID=E2BUX8_HARSA|nr:hypothetical protein EAI_05655 [Harpegnathos saltator]